MVAAGDFSWNGGIFLFRAGDFLNALGQFEPDMLAATQAAMAAVERDGVFLRPDEAAFAACPSNSIDYAVMERAEKVAVAPVSMGWSDVGSWDALYDLGEAAGGVEPLAIDTARCLIRSDGIRVHTVGVSDLIIVAAGNDILILPRGESARQGLVCREGEGRQAPFPLIEGEDAARRRLAALRTFVAKALATAQTNRRRNASLQINPARIDERCRAARFNAQTNRKIRNDAACRAGLRAHRARKREPALPIL
eukprot:gene28371-50214_t